MFFCSRCGCAAGAHSVCATWAAENDAAKRRAEAAHRARAHAQAQAGAQLAMQQRDSLLALLGAPPNATRAQAAAAYRRQALRWHPDKQTGSEAARQAASQRFCAVADAWRQLCLLDGQ